MYRFVGVLDNPQVGANYHWEGFCSEKLDKENKKDHANLTIRANTFTAFLRLRGITTSIAFEYIAVTF